MWEVTWGGGEVVPHTSLEGATVPLMGGFSIAPFIIIRDPVWSPRMGPSRGAHVWTSRGHIVVEGRVSKMVWWRFLWRIVPVWGALQRALRQTIAVVKWVWSGARGVVKIIEAGARAMESPRRWHGVCGGLRLDRGERSVPHLVELTYICHAH